MLRRKAVVDRLENSDAILSSLAQAVEQRDNITGGHCDRMSALCVAMGSTVFFIMVSLPAVTAPKVACLLAEIPIACWICSHPRCMARPATIGETNAVSVA